MKVRRTFPGELWKVFLFYILLLLIYVYVYYQVKN